MDWKKHYRVFVKMSTLPFDGKQHYGSLWYPMYFDKYPQMRKHAKKF